MHPVRMEIEACCPWSGARAGLITTPHGVIETAVFMPVGTQGTVKALTREQVGQIGSPIVLADSYRRNRRPGTKLIAEAGGLLSFDGWHKPILTDSGGF